jgi:cytochrome c oxidase subunit 3
MYIAIGSMTMMFAGWISAYMVRQGQGRWDHVHLPTPFWISTVLIIASSITIHLTVRAFKKKEFGQYKALLTTTIILGVAFLISQIVGFTQLYNLQDVRLNSNNAAGEFTYVIPFVHGVHVLGGLVAMLIVFISTSIRRRKGIFKSTGIELVSIYWHFVDALWLYIFIFLLVNQS